MDHIWSTHYVNCSFCDRSMRGVLIEIKHPETEYIFSICKLCLERMVEDS